MIKTFIMSVLNEAKGWWDDEQSENEELMSCLVPSTTIIVSGKDTIYGVNLNLKMIIVRKNVEPGVETTWSVQGDGTVAGYPAFLSYSDSNGWCLDSDANPYNDKIAIRFAKVEIVPYDD